MSALKFEDIEVGMRVYAQHYSVMTVARKTAMQVVTKTENGYECKWNASDLAFKPLFACRADVLDHMADQSDKTAVKHDDNAKYYRDNAATLRAKAQELREGEQT